ncbi:MAG TPA: PEP/pyruvate-binding domain-containing protein [Motiliproteus sp.]
MTPTTALQTPSHVPSNVPWLLPLAAITPAQRELVGGKALHLGRLIQAGFAVPPGFCLTSAALAGPAPEQLPTVLLQPLLEAWRQLPAGPVAVRSSAIEEDQQHASWAGVFHTHLNITSEAELCAAVLDCWRSLHSSTVSQFRRQRQAQPKPRPHPKSQPPAMAVIVQQQVNASAAGVLFSRNPLHPERAEICINALFGLGEPLVSGQEQGDRYHLDRTGNVRQQQIHCQRQRLGVHGLQALAPERGSRSTLDVAQLRLLAATANQLEALFNAPQDCEFAFSGNQLWLLQSRPIVSASVHAAVPDSQAVARFRQQEIDQLRTKLQQLQQHRVLRHGPGILSNGNIGELLPTPTPMSFTLFQHLFTGEGGAIPRGRKSLGYQLAPRANRELFTLVAGQPYFHLELDARSYDLQQPQPVSHYLAAVRQQPLRANYPEFGLYLQCAEPSEAIALLGQDAGSALAHSSQRHAEAMRRFARDYYPRYRRRIEPELQRHRLSMQRCSPGHTSQALLIRISALIQHLQQVSCYHFVIAARLGFYFAESLRCRLQRSLPEHCNALMAQLLQALPGSRISEQLLDLSALNRGELSQADFVRHYGHLALNELEIALPRFHEAPEQLQRLSNANGERADSHAQFRQQLRQRKGVERRLRQQLEAAAIPTEEQQALFRDLRLARRYLPLRETIKYHFAAEYDLLRQTLLSFADATGLERGGVFYLEPAELALAINRHSEAERLIGQRRQQHALAKALAASQPLPAVIFADDLDQACAPPSSQGGERWQGEGIAPGIRRGRLRLVDEQHDLLALARSLQPNDILVTRSANLGLAPLLRSVAGLVVEIGGFLAHAACQAREAGIPAMVLPDATRLLQEGSEVVLDGKDGTLCHWRGV